MAFPKKGTHEIALANGQTYLWHLDRKWFDRTSWLAVREKDTEGQLLLIDPYHCNFLPSQATVRIAIRTAYRLGWNPKAKAAPLRLDYDGAEFVPVAEM